MHRVSTQHLAPSTQNRPSPLCAQCYLLSAKGAFSLIELVISMAILSIGLLGAMPVFPIGLRASQRAELRSRATITAQRTIESLKLKSWDELVVGDSTVEDGDFSVTTRVAQPSVEHLVDASRLKAIEVTVRWTQDQRPRQLTFVTYVRRDQS